ncbi:M48 family metalloprotease [Aureimonas fodinaquatilis]|uniref:M48 family metalloprotease n=2 Tax=Aureimonas fodinaquatilis TaxID=2565783 RepID=A0A5B0DYY4_9HYPH|nr:M48 family metalloprotease [Aureimonas fodinaquatilis]
MLLSLAACGTTYELPTITENNKADAQKLFAEAKSAPHSQMVSPEAAESRFHRVKDRVGPVATELCKQESAANSLKDCNATIVYDRTLQERNAFFYYDDEQPRIIVTQSFVQTTKNDDELAFVLGHEYGHLIGRHIEKQKQQRIAGAIILGAATAYVQAQSQTAYSYASQAEMDRNIDAGMAMGDQAYSQTYELESDMLGARIAAAAGYNPKIGAAFFARPEDSRSVSGTSLSFWGTHPSDERRVAIVLATQQQISQKQGLVREKPSRQTP